VVILHEFAHGLTCKHFGGQVHEMGFLLIYFQPAFFCNVSDAWLFPRKSHRLWVTFAGAYFEMCLWAIAMLVWRLTEPQTAVNHFALIVVATSAIKSVFNMNPLIKLDGYYLLSDWLGIPNLRNKSSEYLRSGGRAMLGLRANWPAGATARERTICLIYGAIATAFSAWLLTSVALYFGGRLTGKYQAWGFVCFVALLGGVFRNSVRKSFKTVVSALQPTRPAAVRWRRLAKVLGLSSLLFAFLCWGHMDLRISGEFVILPVHNTDVRAEVEGIIEGVFVEEGDLVNAGQLIVRLSDRDYQAELRKTQAATEEKKAQLKLLEAGPRAEEITLARTAVAKAEERLKFENRRLEMDRKLFEEQLLSRRDLEQTEELATVRGKELDEAKEHLQMLLAGSRPEEVEAVAAEVRRLEVQSRHYEDQLRLLSVASPVAGVVTTRKPKEIVGQRAAKGDLIVKVHELNTVTAEISVSEKDIDAVRVGQPVILKCRAYPQITFRGTVASIASIATKPHEWQLEHSILVTTQIPNESLALKPEMTGNAKISCGERRLLDILTRRLARYLRVEFWSWW
jgi:putative peptide zinc metalloprotease protein